MIFTKKKGKFKGGKSRGLIFEATKEHPQRSYGNFLNLVTS